MQLPAHDVQILRELARRKAEIAQDPVNEERRRAWYALDAGQAARPMVLAEIGGIQDERRPVAAAAMRCESDAARRLEWGLRNEIYQFEELRDDHVVEPWVQCNWQVRTTGYGVEIVKHKGSNDAGHGSWKVEPPLKNLPEDLEKLTPRTFAVDREATAQARADLAELFDGILPVRLRGSYWWTLGLTGRAIDLIGLEEMMLAMFDAPEGLHGLMTFLRDDALHYAEWLEAEGLLQLNNENDYIGSGSMGYTQRLPQAGRNGRVRLKDQWLLLESQETVGVGPEQFAEFIFPYQKSLADRFGLVYYGCCEPVHNRWHVLTELDNLSRVSVSPWCDEPFMAAACGEEVVYSRKPNPTLVSTDCFDEAAIRADLRHTLETAGPCRLEIVMKDVHTLKEEPDRLARWVALARDEIRTAGRPDTVA